MRTFPRALALLTVGVLAFTTGGAGMARADGSGSIADTVGPSLVFLQTEFTAAVQIPFESGNRWLEDLTVTGNCTGYVVDPAGYVATAGHCVDPSDEGILNAFRQRAVETVARAQGRDDAWASRIYEQAVAEEWTVRAPNGDTGAATTVRLRQPTGDHQLFPEWTAVDVVNYQSFDEGDNALVKVAPRDGLRALVISAEAPEPGDEVVAVGFPGAVQSTNESTAIAQPSYKNGTVSSRQNSDNGLYRTEISAVLGQGMSGGPTVGADGAVVGTNSSGAALRDEKASFNFITDNIALRSYLERHGVTLAVAPKQDSSLNPWVWIGPLIGAGVLLLGGMTWMLLRRRRRPAAPAADRPQMGRVRRCRRSRRTGPDPRPGPSSSPTQHNPRPPQNPQPRPQAQQPPPRPRPTSPPLGEQPTVLNQPRPNLPPQFPGGPPHR
ncbi:serine protease [Gordonia alkaliphila]|uniref:S1 family peptidase n=1 Tax=Gordonia alkaliphila TaxID=1053547 RepID=UPI001FF43A56|nr:serine protease [Gordonia alkaliphila]MCK0440616.1 serine protease [Gordonia alkaliphila]